MIGDICTLIIGYWLGWWLWDRFKHRERGDETRVTVTYAEMAVVADAVIEHKIRRGELERL